MKKTDVKTVEDIEQYYKKCRRLKFKEGKEPKDLKEVFARLLGNDTSATCGARGGHHCHNGKYRSLDDYIAVSKTYFPDLTVKHIISELMYNFSKDKYKASTTRNEDYYVCARYCPNIRKDNFCISMYGSEYQAQNYLENRTFSDSGFRNCYIRLINFVK